MAGEQQLATPFFLDLIQKLHNYCLIPSNDFQLKGQNGAVLGRRRKFVEMLPKRQTTNELGDESNFANNNIPQ